MERRERVQPWDKKPDDTGGLQRTEKKRKYKPEELPEKNDVMKKIQMARKAERNENIREDYKHTIPLDSELVTIARFKGKHQESMQDEVTRLARFGLTNEEIAEFYEISIGTFKRYVRDIKEFRDALEEGRLIDSMRVVDSLHKQALGYYVDEKEVAEHIDRHGDIHKLVKKTTKYVQPSATAAIYLLKTRHGDKWMDIIKTEATRNLNISVKNVDFSDISTDDLLLLKQVGIKRIPESLSGKKDVNESNTIQDVRGN